jgi:MoCo/4Fe-4S cofactor protein with predicted Tat translocation signal
MASEKNSRYWKSWEQGPGASDLVPISTGEFPEPLSEPAQQLSRRSFLKAAGFTAAAAAMTAGCSRAPVEKAIPYLVQPEEIIPGVSYFYASTCGGCAAGCGVLVKTREGRPVKLEGNPQHPLSRGGLCAVGQASLLGLYDSHRLTGPRIEGKAASWEEVDQQIVERLSALRASGGAVRFLSGTITSPSLLAELQKFLAQFGDARHIVYDALSSSAIPDAHEQTHGARALPHYRFDRAEVIVSFDADFLGTWISPVEFSREYAAGRKLDAHPPRMSYHAQLESRMSLTGSKADRRVAVAPQELAQSMYLLAERVARLAGKEFPAPESGAKNSTGPLLDQLAQQLWAARGKSLVVCGSQDLRLQVLSNFINEALGNYGATLDLERPSQQKMGNDRQLQTLLQEIKKGEIGALFLLGVNPVYDLPEGNVLAEQVRRIPLVVSFADRINETSAAARFIGPDHHPLESWGDAEPVRATISLLQPAIQPLGKTRPVIESLAAWRGQPRPAYDILREHWRKAIFPRQKAEKDFEAFWDHAVERGVVEIAPASAPKSKFHSAAISALPGSSIRPAEGFSLVLYPKVSMLDGRHAENPWLQELPDPITKVVWDNYANISPASAQRLGVQEGDVVRLETLDGTGASLALELPAYVQPGQSDSSVSVALGYGSVGTQRFARIGPQWIFARPDVGEDGRVGKNAAPLLEFVGGNLQFASRRVRLSKTGKRHALASTQSHHTLTMPKDIPLVGGEQREIVQETTLAALAAGAMIPLPPAKPANNGLWPPDHEYKGHRWAMAIDLTACTGCSGCVIACQAENNIPVVGKDEVLRHREMHWMRIDRYYRGDDDVDVVHQPMFCQQCDNAPCETVCPVLATVHSAEGLNQQVYNRCVGTRYCANNCPYKTRRFNWFNYAREDRLQNLALNPDVTVRSRGIMEKCTFCVQRIEAARIVARRQGKAIADGAIQTACQQSCPSQAIVFGNLNDPKSHVAQMAKDPRRFGVLEEFNFRPAVSYLAVVRNRAPEDEKSKENKTNG